LNSGITKNVTKHKHIWSQTLPSSHHIQVTSNGIIFQITSKSWYS